MSRVQRWLVAAIAISAISGYASVSRGTTEAWSAESDPIGASVVLSSGETCLTPCTQKKRRKDDFSVTISKGGEHPVHTQVIRQVAGAGAAGMAGHVLVGGIIGEGVAAAAGSTKELKLNPLVVKLVPLKPVTDHRAIETPWPKERRKADREPPQD